MIVPVISFIPLNFFTKTGQYMLQIFIDMEHIFFHFYVKSLYGFPMKGGKSVGYKNVNDVIWKRSLRTIIWYPPPARPGSRIRHSHSDLHIKKLFFSHEVKLERKKKEQKRESKKENWLWKLTSFSLSGTGETYPELNSLSDSTSLNRSNTSSKWHDLHEKC